ncbi:copper transporter [Leucobacter sp. OH2974_COT-288]|nr:copper transporter [Leucobacter sp. OH2974_COT-288]
MSRSVKVFAPALALLLGFTAVSLLLGLQVGGAAAPRELLDPGAVVRYLLPAARTVVNVSLAAMLGTLILTLWALDPKRPEWGKALDFAAAAAGVLTVAGGVTLITTFIDVSSQPFSASAQFGASLAQFITEFELGILWLTLVLLSAVTSVLLFAIRGRRLLLVALVPAMLTTFPLAAQGHASGASGHSLAVNSIFMHLTGASIWLGGLLVLALLISTVDAARLPLIVRRYSVLALFAALLVFTSGVVSGLTRLNSPADLTGTGYGWLLLLKTASLAALIGFGAWQRLRLIGRLEAAPESRKTYAWILAAELAVMGLASGFAGALGRSATPAAITPARELGATITPAEYLTGDPLPPELTFTSIFTVWKFDLLWAAVTFGGIGLYCYGVWILRRRGDKWPLGRTVSWVSGMLLLGYVTNGFLNAYEAYLFSLHMLGHMFLTMLIPLLLVLGAPVTLLLRAAAKRQDGSWGAREWVLWLVETPYSRFITNPVVAAAIFAGSLWVFYFTPVLRWSMSTHLGHQWMIIHFLLSGYLFTLALIGVDPVPHRAPYPLRVIILLATMAAHAFFGVTVMSSTGLLAADWFGAMGRVWGDPPLVDQQSGGGIAWGIGELPTLFIMLVVSIQWARSDEKEQRRKDRAAERSGDAELMAYNEMLAARAAQAQRQPAHGRQ